MIFRCTKKWTLAIVFSLACFFSIFCFSSKSYAASPTVTGYWASNPNTSIYDWRGITYGNGKFYMVVSDNLNYFWVCYVTDNYSDRIGFATSSSGTFSEFVPNISAWYQQRDTSGNLYFIYDRFSGTMQPWDAFGNTSLPIVHIDNWNNRFSQIIAYHTSHLGPTYTDGVSEIGYLRNVNQKSGVYQIKESALIVEDYGYKIGFDATTTEGVSVISKTMEVIVSGDLSVRSGTSLRKLGNFSSEAQFIDYSGTSFNFNSSDLISMIRSNNDTGNYSDYMYYLTNVSFKIRPIVDDKFGGWTLLKFSDYDGNTSNYSSVSSSNVNNDGLTDGINQNGTGTSNQNFGVGGSAADASGNITERPNTQLDASKLTENLSSLASEVQSMVGVFASLFGWLPDWCLILMASCIASLFVIAVLKVALF